MALFYMLVVGLGAVIIMIETNSIFGYWLRMLCAGTAQRCAFVPASSIGFEAARRFEWWFGVWGLWILGIWGVVFGAEGFGIRAGASCVCFFFYMLGRAPSETGAAE